MAGAAGAAAAGAGGPPPPPPVPPAPAVRHPINDVQPGQLLSFQDWGKHLRADYRHDGFLDPEPPYNIGGRDAKKDNGAEFLEHSFWLYAQNKVSSDARINAEFQSRMDARHDFTFPEETGEFKPIPPVLIPPVLERSGNAQIGIVMDAGKNVTKYLGCLNVLTFGMVLDAASSPTSENAMPIYYDARVGGIFPRLDISLTEFGYDSNIIQSISIHSFENGSNVKSTWNYTNKSRSRYDPMQGINIGEAATPVNKVINSLDGNYTGKESAETLEDKIGKTLGDTMIVASAMPTFYGNIPNPYYGIGGNAAQWIKLYEGGGPAPKVPTSLVVKTEDTLNAVRCIFKNVPVIYQRKADMGPKKFNYYPSKVEEDKLASNVVAAYDIIVSNVEERYNSICDAFNRLFQPGTEILQSGVARFILDAASQEELEAAARAAAGAGGAAAAGAGGPAGAKKARGTTVISGKEQLVKAGKLIREIITKLQKLKDIVIKHFRTKKGAIQEIVERLYGNGRGAGSTSKKPKSNAPSLDPSSSDAGPGLMDTSGDSAAARAAARAAAAAAGSGAGAASKARRPSVPRSASSRGADVALALSDRKRKTASDSPTSFKEIMDFYNRDIEHLQVLCPQTNQVVRDSSNNIMVPIIPITRTGKVVYLDVGAHIAVPDIEIRLLTAFKRINEEIGKEGASGTKDVSGRTDVAPNFYDGTVFHERFTTRIDSVINTPGQREARVARVARALGAAPAAAGSGSGAMDERESGSAGGAGAAAAAPRAAGSGSGAMDERESGPAGGARGGANGDGRAADADSHELDSYIKDIIGDDAVDEIPPGNVVPVEIVSGPTKDEKMSLSEKFIPLIVAFLKYYERAIGLDLEPKSSILQVLYTLIRMRNSARIMSPVLLDNILEEFKFLKEVEVINYAEPIEALEHPNSTIGTLVYNAFTAYMNKLNATRYYDEDSTTDTGNDAIGFERIEMKMQEKISEKVNSIKAAAAAAEAEDAARAAEAARLAAAAREAAEAEAARLAAAAAAAAAAPAAAGSGAPPEAPSESGTLLVDTSLPIGSQVESQGSVYAAAAAAPGAAAAGPGAAASGSFTPTGVRRGAPGGSPWSLSASGSPRKGGTDAAPGGSTVPRALPFSGGTRTPRRKKNRKSTYRLKKKPSK